MSLKLYELNTAIEQAIQYDPETGEITPESEARLDALALTKAEKVTNIACMVKDAVREESAIQSEMQALNDRLEAKVNACRHRAEWGKMYLAQWMDAGEKIEDARAEVRCAEAESVVFDWEKSEEGAPDLSMIGWQADCLKITTTVKPIKATIKKRIKAGEDVPRARIVVNKHVVIR